jgi:protein gp37
MQKTKIEWADYTWNPVTGCLGHNGAPCPYCYARRIARHYGGILTETRGGRVGNLSGMMSEEDKIHDLKRAEVKLKDNKEVSSPYPYGFDPTFHRYRLDEPQRIKKPSTIFVCSMADLFGDFIPDSWIEQVFEACAQAPQHRYLFLTKNPKRYKPLMRQYKFSLPPEGNMYFGMSLAHDKDVELLNEYADCMDFVSIEPIQERICFDWRGKYDVKWVIIGAETGNRKNKVIPKREWIQNIVGTCRENNISVFMKNNLQSVWGDELIQELPWSSK